MTTSNDLACALEAVRLLAPGVGATTAYSDVYPEAVRTVFRRRDLDRHDYFGFTMSQPSSTIIVGGRAYEDLNSGQHKEDALVFDLQTGTATHMRPRHFLRSFPEYQGYHYGDKSYLRVPFEFSKTPPI